MLKQVVFGAVDRQEEEPSAILPDSIFKDGNILCGLCTTLLIVSFTIADFHGFMKEDKQISQIPIQILKAIHNVVYTRIP